MATTSHAKKIFYPVLLLAFLLTAALLPKSASAPSQNPAVGPYHVSTMLSKSFYDDAYAQAPAAIRPDGHVTGGVLPHHLLAAPLMAQFFSGLESQAPDRVILIGPDHLSRGKHNISVTLENWKTPYDMLETDQEAVDNLIGVGAAFQDESPFDDEFSVGGLVPFIKKTFPTARVVTIIVRTTTTQAEIDRLVESLPKDNSTLFLASEDFSHYLPSRIAQFHDTLSQTVINSFVAGDVSKIEVDSLPNIRIMLGYLKACGAMHSQKIQSTNSAIYTGQNDAAETTSYLTEYFSAGLPETSGKISVLIKGPFDTKGSPEERFNQGFDLSDRESGVFSIRGKTLNFSEHKSSFGIWVAKTKTESQAQTSIDAGAVAAVVYGYGPSSIAYYKDKPIIKNPGNVLNGVSQIYGLVLGSETEIYAFPVSTGEKWWLGVH